MLIISGTSALSAYRLNQLLTKLQTIDQYITAVSAQFIHYIDCEKPLDPLQHTMLERLLSYGYAATDIDESAMVFQVAPRPGTISPWSSKATEIVECCGISAVKRVERVIEYRISKRGKLAENFTSRLYPLIHDRMTQVVYCSEQVINLFEHRQPKPLQTINILEQGLDALQRANFDLGLALSSDEMDYLIRRFQTLERNPSDVELMMFAQANSEHCRHKIFNADWTIDHKLQGLSLFAMICHTTEQSPKGILSAYSDNSSIIEGSNTQVLIRNPRTGIYQYHEEPAHLLMKVETHNHPTAISPRPGAATGAGGEIRDEGATGRGSSTKAGLTGFSVSHLNIPGFEQPWEIATGQPERIASALNIMLEGPIGSAMFNNEFGRPNLAGYFRNFEQMEEMGKPGHYRGYHKPIMIAGGMGNIRPMLVEKQPIPVGSLIIILGGPAMLIGLGGGAASSQTSGESATELDFASVQRENPEMERRCQEVINQCNALGDKTPIISIHDIGAGGLSNAVPEIIHDCQRGGHFQLRHINNADKGMSPMQIWCNEAQERYVIAISPESLALFESFCQREHCLYAVIGEVKAEEWLTLSDKWLGGNPVDIPMSVLFGQSPKIYKQVSRSSRALKPFISTAIDLDEAVNRVLRFPTVADKSFLIHIGDRSVTGLVARDQMVGPWQVPVADVAVTASGFQTITGEAMAMGERTPLALISAPASGRMAVAESLTNLVASRIEHLGQVKLSANWMAASGEDSEDVALFDTVKAVAMDLCPALGIAIPVGKDSLSMKTVWDDKVMTAPLSLIITAFAPVVDITQTLTPQLRDEDSVLLLLDLGQGKNRLGGSVLAQSYQQLGNDAPDLDNVDLFIRFFNTIQQLNQANQLLAYHDRSDGGLLTTVAEMLFAGRQGITIELAHLLDQNPDPLAALFNEELGAVIQVRRNDLETVLNQLTANGLARICHCLGQVNQSQQLTITLEGKELYRSDRANLQQTWSEVSYRIQALRDNPDCARQQFEQIADNDDPGLTVQLSFDLNDDIGANLTSTHKPCIAILREQGVNGHVEMAAAFDKAGFSAVDVHMTDIIHGRTTLSQFVGLVACGGFSYGDVLGAGGGWAKSILFNDRARFEFEQFFNRQNTFALGVCNGCQMMAGLKSIIPGAEHWADFKPNQSEQFEARVTRVIVEDSPSIFMAGMAGSILPVVVAHGEGRVKFDSLTDQTQAQIALRYVDNYGAVTEQFPANPNGSPAGITGFTTVDGRFTIMMPHPERCFRAVQNSWHPDNWQDDGAWLRMFRNARVWVGE